MVPISKGRVESHRGHTVIGFPRHASPLVIDCGAHKGEFAASVCAAWDARCLSIEASPVLFEALSLPPKATGFNLAIAGEDGEVSFAISDNPEGSFVGQGGSGERQVTVPARGLAAFLDENAPGDIDLLKLDIEGAEIPALASLSARQLDRIGQISCEFHDFCGYATSQQVDAAIGQLQAAGFEMINFAVFTRGDVLFVNRRHHRLGLTDRLRLKYWERIKRGIQRRLH